MYFFEKHIQKLLNEISQDNKNEIDNIYLDKAKNEFFALNKSLLIDSIPVTGLTTKEQQTIVEELTNIIPEFLVDHYFLLKPKPASDSLSLFFIKPLKGEVYNFLHYLKLDFSYRGEFSHTIKKGDTEHYPSYETNDLFFKSKIFPVLDVSIQKDYIADNFEPLRIFSREKVKSDQYFHTVSIFDEVQSNEMTKLILEKINIDAFSISTNVYSFFEYFFFSASMNVINPTKDQLVEAINLFEPVFIKIMSSGNSENLDADLKNKIEKLKTSLILTDNKIINFTEEFKEKLKNYFSQYSIYTDNDLTIKRWKRIDFKK